MCLLGVVVRWSVLGWGGGGGVFVGGEVECLLGGGRGGGEMEYVPSDLQRSWRADGPVTRRMKWVHYASRSLS